MAASSLIKQPAESRLYTMDFAANMDEGETISGVTSVAATPSGLTLSGPATFSDTRAFQRIAGGTAGVSYKVTFLVTTSAGNTLEGEGLLLVRDL
jgi:hypothetical protein